VTSLLPDAVESFLETGGAALQRVDLVIMGVVALLLLEYDVLRGQLGENSRERLRPLGVALVPLVVACGIVIAHRWRQLSP
jgi:hypothetical protein